jgi:hypothetical protein
MQLRMKLTTVAAAGAASVALVAGGTALASTHASTSKSVTGPEVIAGTVHGKAALANAPTIPLQWLGVVRTRSVINLGGSGPHKGSVKTLKSRAGNLTVMVTSKPTSSQQVNTRTCRFSFRQDIPVRVVSSKSTGAFAGASGPGAAQVTFAATAPRFKSGPKKGQCNPNGQPKARGASASFLASVVLTVRK